MIYWVLSYVVIMFIIGVIAGIIFHIKTIKEYDASAPIWSEENVEVLNKIGAVPIPVVGWRFVWMPFIMIVTFVMWIVYYILFLLIFVATGSRDDFDFKNIKIK